MKIVSAVRALAFALLPFAAYSQSTCINFPPQETPDSIPFVSIAYVTPANNLGDHLIVGSLLNGAKELSAIRANIPLPTVPNQMFCGQVQLAPQQFYANVYVPTSSELSGIFSGFAGLLVDPVTKQPYSGGVIPPAQLGSVFAWRIGPVQTTSPIQGWNPTGSMSAARADHAAVLLPNGKVFVVGSARNADLYDPATGNFQPVGRTLFDHGFTLTATLLGDGRVFILGGTNSPSGAELYDPVSGKFTAAAAPLQPHGYAHSATLLNDGRVLLVGGLTLPGTGGSCSDTNAGAEFFDPKSGTYSKAAPLQVNRNYHTATLLQDGRVLIAGGILKGAFSAPCNAELNSAEIFDPSSGAFSSAGPMQQIRGAGFAVLLPSGKVLLGGGDAAEGSAELFDPATATFTATGSMSDISRAIAGAILLPNGQVLVAGGKGVLGTPTDAVELYNPATGTFSVTGSLGLPRAGLTVTLLVNGKVLAAGGAFNYTFQTTASAEIFTPVIQGLVTSQTGLTFRAAQGASASLSQTVVALSAIDSIPWTVSTHTFTGGGWLTATPSAGTSSPGTAGVTISISANPAGLAAQDYYGSVTLSPSDTVHSPVSISVILSIVPAGTAAPPTVAPSGLLFLAAPGATVKPQSFSITNLTSSVIGFNATATANPSWFTFTPKASGISPGATATVTVTPTLTGLTPAVYRGSITLTFSDNSTQTVDLLLVISSTTTSSSAPAMEPKATSGCTPAKLVPIFTSLGIGFTTPVAWPTPIVVQVVDDCGNLISTGTVAVSFSNGDAPLSLLSIGSGSWTATWVPVRSSTTALAVRADAQLAPLNGSVQVTGQVATNPNVPLVASGGVLSSGDYTSSPALGLLVSIFGSALADGQVGANSLPLPSQLGSTSVIVSGKQVPVLFVNDKQVNVLIPYDLAVNAPHQLIVQRGSAISVPIPIAIFDSQPAILATAGNGTGQGHIYKIDSSGNQILADANAPATAGDYLVIYTVGLGAVNPPVNAGDPAGSNPPSSTTAPVTLTIGGIQAPVFFSGLTPGSAGLYQVNAVVPAGITPGTQVPVAVSVGGKSSAGNIYMSIQ
ncbi:MAG TPA: hypothetical protein VKX49_23125 [Bryobacteraceae bacterium]|nr:hypothetical protein [Bryobacteraceae bacterium]